MSEQKDIFEHKAEPVTENPWHTLNAFTDARVGLGRSGVSVPTKHLLAFQLAHAQAIDAVHTPFSMDELANTLSEQPWAPAGKPFQLHSLAVDRAAYLQRPDYGRRLNEHSARLLDEYSANKAQPYDLAIVIADGLSSLAIEQNTHPFLEAFFLSLYASKQHWHMAPLCLVEQGRVAIGDDVCERLNAKCVLVLIGERPGLSSPDSLGLYLTWGGKVGLTDAFRNCISNVRPAGMSYPDAARKAVYLLNEARTLKLSGVKLKDRSNDDAIDSATNTNNFLVE